jgi:two-component system sensor histidine kinase RegB
MSADVLARAGHPFFTTKEPGKGLGLGLFLCRSVVERLGGSLELTSQPGHGTSAVVHLPG